MGVKAAGSVFWVSFLMLFPVAVQLCVTYKHREICGVEGSSVNFPCSYPKHVQVTSTPGWFRRFSPHEELKSLKKKPSYLVRMTEVKHGKNDCTMKLKHLKKSDASVYYFGYSFRHGGEQKKCLGVPGVRLSIFQSPVSILVTKLVLGQYEPVADGNVVTGQSILLTCAPTCTANLKSNPGYIWYKNYLQLNVSRWNSSSLSLDSFSNEDAGVYFCVMNGFSNLPSSAVKLVQGPKPRNTTGSNKDNNDSPGGPKKVPTPCDGKNCTDQISIMYQTPIYMLFIILLVSCCAGLFFSSVVAVLVLKVKNKKKERCAGSVPRPPNPDNDYMSLDINSTSPDYNTLDLERRHSDPVYEN